MHFHVQVHLLNGDPARDGEGAIPVHEKCAYCREICYDLGDLHAHMLDKHLSCQVCRRMGRRETGVADARLLIDHYNQEHFTCSDTRCQENFLENVFDSDISLRAHVISVHKDSFESKQALKDAQKLAVEFRSQKSSGDNRGAHESSGSEARNMTSDWGPTPAVASSSRPGMARGGSYASSSSVNSELASAKNSGAVAKAAEKSLLDSTDPREQNKKLISEIRRLTGEMGFRRFRDISAEYVSKAISADMYYSYFCKMFGDYDTAGPLWMLLVSSNPDPTLRAELYQTHFSNKSKGGGFQNLRNSEGGAAVQSGDRSDSNGKSSSNSIKISQALDYAVGNIAELSIDDNSDLKADGASAAISPEANSSTLVAPEGNSTVEDASSVPKQQRGKFSKKKGIVLMKWG